MNSSSSMSVPGMTLNDGVVSALEWARDWLPKKELAPSLSAPNVYSVQSNGTWAPSTGSMLSIWQPKSQMMNAFLRAAAGAQ